MWFYGIYLKLKYRVFKSWKCPCQALAVDRVDRCAQDMHKGQVIWPVGRAVDWLKSAHSRVRPIDRAVDRSLWPGRPGGRPAREQFSLDLARSTGRSIGGLNGHIFDRWPVDLPVDRKGKNALFSCQRADPNGVINTPIWVSFQQEFQEPKFLIFSSV